ncbi:hypothetical protein LX36DRAFT_651389 [Colletotrichum falcatum]|nr:hypothetical protein LX36DRAFT_651389 [Colletotrichum falcatum]
MEESLLRGAFRALSSLFLLLSALCSLACIFAPSPGNGLPTNGTEERIHSLSCAAIAIISSCLSCSETRCNIYGSDVL